jgi:hypothetical protein
MKCLHQSFGESVLVISWLDDLFSSSFLGNSRCPIILQSWKPLLTWSLASRSVGWLRLDLALLGATFLFIPGLWLKERPPHGPTLLLADGRTEVGLNYSSTSNASALIRCDVHCICSHAIGRGNLPGHASQWHLETPSSKVSHGWRRKGNVRCPSAKQVDVGAFI